MANIVETITAGSGSFLSPQEKTAIVDLVKPIVIDTIFPVGSIFMSTSSVNPQTYLGGTWVAWGSGCVPVGVNAGDSDFNTVEKTGGEKKHKLTTSEMPSHNHEGTFKLGGNNTSLQAYAAGSDWTGIRKSGSYYGDCTLTLTANGSDGEHNNLQPYITCYMWKRTA